MLRNEQRTEDTWDLSSLFKDDEEFYASLKRCERMVKKLSSYKGSFKEGKEKILEFLTLFEKTGILFERVTSYGFLSYEADGSDPKNQEMMGKAQNLADKFSLSSSFIEPEMLSLGKEKMLECLTDPRFKPYSVAIKKMLRMGKHTLSEKEERLMSILTVPTSNFQSAFSELTNVDMKFPDVRGNKLTHSNFGVMMRSKDEGVREDAYKAYYGEFDKHRNTIARLYQGSVQSDISYSKAKNYKSSLEAALYSDRVPESVYRNLVSTVHEGFPLLHRYYGLMAKCLRKDKLRHWDVYAPMAEDDGKRMTFEEGLETIREAVAPLGKEYQETLYHGIRDCRWVDRYENEGKRSGAFSAGGFTGKPYILMSWQDESPSSAFTLIHEGGHSMHTLYSAKNNPFLSYNYTIFEAEVASTFNENLLFKHLMRTEKDEKRKAFLLSERLHDITATLFRQTMFAEFELISHEAAEKGEVLNADFLRKTYRGLLEAYFGPVMEFEEASDLECLRIPHFYTAFYVYKYATGIAASMALSKGVLEGGDEEREKYISFLKSGGSRYPIDSLRRAGCDLSSPEPVRKAIEEYGAMLDMFEGSI